MKQIALVSVALNAIAPITSCIQKRLPDARIVNYLDSYILKKVEQDNGVISAQSMERMFSMLAKAKQDGADGIIMTCTIFSPYADRFADLLSVPVVCPDGAMLDAVAKEGGKTAIICTFSGTVKTTKSVFFSYLQKYNRPQEVDMHLVAEAFDAAQKGDLENHDRFIQQKIQELDGSYDHVVLAQITMARAAKNCPVKHAKLWTSPESAANAAVSLF